MKRFLTAVFALIMLVSFVACGSDSAPADDTSPTPAVSDETEISAESEETEEKPDGMNFSLLSRTEGWRTEITLYPDGTFDGVYLDSDISDTGYGYSLGTVYICEFNGTFENITQINEYSYSMTLGVLNYESEVGDEWINNRVRYVGTEVVGLTDGSEYILYTPEAPVSELSENFLSWWPYRFDQEKDYFTELTCYGIYNCAEEYGFFGVEQ